MRSEILQRVAILRKINETYDVESAYFTTDKPTTLVIIFKTFDALEQYLESMDHEIFNEMYNIKYDCKETDQ